MLAFFIENKKILKLPADLKFKPKILKADCAPTLSLE